MKKTAISSLFVLLLMMPQAHASFFGNNVLFDVKERKELLQTPAYQLIKSACLAEKRGLKAPSKNMPEPVMALKSTKAYGTDRAMGTMSWYVMIHSGRSMAGDIHSTQKIKDALLKWAGKKALTKTEKTHDAYYALKRSLIPLITSYIVVKDSLSSSEKTKIEKWLDPLVRKVDKKFNGRVDHNNHRYLADAVLTLWGDVIGDKALYAKGAERFKIAIDQMRPDGSLPMETVRGARAIWYMRQSLANLTFIAEIYAQNGENLYSYKKDGKSLDVMMNYFLSAARNQFILLKDASHNLIPGPSDNFLQQDMGNFVRRGKRQHYMAFSHIYLAHDADTLSAQRLQNFMDETGFKDLPLIDDYIGGNATCFWGAP